MTPRDRLDAAETVGSRLPAVRPPTPVADVEALCRLMREYGVTRLTFGDVILERPLTPPKPPEKLEAEFDRIAKLPADKQDAALMLGGRR